MVVAYCLQHCLGLGLEEQGPEGRSKSSASRYAKLKNFSKSIHQ